MSGDTVIWTFIICALLLFGVDFLTYATTSKEQRGELFPIAVIVGMIFVVIANLLIK